MNAPDKKRPVAERIAGLDIKTAYRDVRDGIGGSGAASLTDQDIAAALGMVKTRAGKLPVLALETYFGSTLRHETALRAAWADKTEHHTDPADARIRNRFSCAIAVRQFAGVLHAESEIMEYAHLMCSRPIDFTRRVNEVLSWLEEKRAEGLTELRKCLSESRQDREAKKNAAA